MISIIVPALNEASQIGETLSALQVLEGDKEILVVDGGSADQTVPLAAAAGVQVLNSTRGRGHQQHVGARSARGDVRWFVHADLIPPPDALSQIHQALHDSSVVGGNF
jgi:glycosyltransferase involved in cell wall biosynthesis